MEWKHPGGLGMKVKPMTLLNGRVGSEENEQSASFLWAVQFVVSLGGAAVMLWLSLRVHLNRIHPLPTFYQRFGRIRNCFSSF